MNKSQRKKFVGINMRLNIISDRCCDQINAVMWKMVTSLILCDKYMQCKLQYCMYVMPIS